MLQFTIKQSWFFAQLFSSQGQDHEPLKVGNASIVKSYLLRYLQWKLAYDHWFLN